MSSKCHECVEQFVEQVHEFVEQVPERYQYLLMCVREGDVGVLSEREGDVGVLRLTEVGQLSLHLRLTVLVVYLCILDAQKRPRAQVLWGR